MKKQRICIAGGGSTHTAAIVQLLLDNHKEFPISEIRLYDTDFKRNDDMNVIVDYILRQNDMAHIDLLATDDPKLAFTGIDFVFAQIRVGGMKMRELDEKIPLKHGLVGQETCGLGGFAYGMRSMGGFLEMVQFIQDYAPDAWILNYTNPESIISESVRRKFPNAKIINACDMTIGIEEALAENFGYDRKNWIADYYGLNHFGWFDSIYDVNEKRDIMPELIEGVINGGISVPGLETSWQKTYDMLGYITSNFPNNISNNYLEYYLYPDMFVEKQDPNYTRANVIMDGRLKHIAKVADLIRENPDVENDDFFEKGAHSQYIVDIALSLLNNLNGRFKLIVPNRGAIPNLRSDAVVEVPVYVNARGVEPISLRHDIPDFHKGLMEAQVAAEKLLVDAFFEGSYQKALEAFTLNQTVPSARVAKLVLDEMIIANEGYWPELK